MAKVLVADDSEFQRWRCVKALREFGHEVLEARDGREAVAIYQREKPHVVLLDITMPEMDGLEALSEIMVIDRAARIAMITAVNQQSVLLKAMKAGATSFVPKPIRLEELDAIVQKLSKKESRPPAAAPSIRLVPA